MQKKKVTVFAVTAGMLLQMGMTAWAADTELRFSSPNELPAVGETFTTQMMLSGNPGVKAVEMSLLYDGSVLRCTEIQLGPALSGGMDVANPTSNKGGKQAAIIAAVDSGSFLQDGIMAEYTFEVLSVGDAGFELMDVVLSDGENRDYDYRAVGIPVRQEMEQLPEQPPSQPDAPDPTPNPTPEPTPEPTPVPIQKFADVPAGHWAFSEISRAAELGLIEGDRDGQFLPNRLMSRAEFVTVLWRMAGAPTVSTHKMFSDVDEKDWYTDAVCWAAEKSLVKGSGDRFDPRGPITREQIMTILFRYNGGISGMEMMLSGIYDSQFKDSATISPWAKDAVYWSVYNGIVGGVAQDTLAPQRAANRAEVTTMILRYTDRMQVGGEA